MGLVRHLLTLGPDHEPMWIRLYVYQVAEKWAATLVADNVGPPTPGEVRGIGFHADAPERRTWACRTPHASERRQ
jgi:hypothetical protein